MGDRARNSRLRDGSASCLRLRAAGEVAHIRADGSKLAAHLKQLSASLEGFQERQLAHLLAFAGPLLPLIRLPRFGVQQQRALALLEAELAQ